MTTTDTYDIGDLPRIDITFKNLAGDPTDPDAVTLKITEPDGNTISKDLLDGVINDSGATGRFYHDFSCTKPGRHYAHWSGSGSLQAAAPYEFYVRRKGTAS